MSVERVQERASRRNGWSKTLILSLLVTLPACSLTPSIKTCEPVPEWLLKLPEKPSANLPEKPKNKDVIRVIEEQDAAHDQVRGQLQGVKVHQAACK